MPAPIDIASRSQAGPAKSNLTSQLRAADQNGTLLMPMNESYSGGRPGSISQSGAIPMAQRIRRESMAHGSLARSFIMGSLAAGGEGMSWGSVRMGSWLGDDIMMGTSPFAHNSPSFHSSSYLPKLEADFCKDFSCCGLPLPTLHDLLRHYEDYHAAQAAPPGVDDKDANRHHRASSQSHQVQQATQRNPHSGMHNRIEAGQRQMQWQKLQEDEHENQDDHQDGEVAGDMEMDDEETTPPPNYSAPLTPQTMHTSHPPTPSHSQTYSNAHGIQSSQIPGYAYPTGHFSPDSSVPGTPLAQDYDYSFQQPQAQAYNTDNAYGNYDYSATGEMGNVCIDQPGKRLFTPGPTPMRYEEVQMFMNANNGLATQYQNPTSGHIPGMATPLLMPEADKPFKCPVIGCEKAYKNQNGLKYHKAHGHVNQRLHDNLDGTFSIVNPETSAPYPGTLGMEKEKPYRCEVCGKRYKNLNGLKYHRNHSTHGDIPPQPHVIPGGVIAVAGGIAGEGSGLL